MIASIHSVKTRVYNIILLYLYYYKLLVKSIYIHLYMYMYTMYHWPRSQASTPTACMQATKAGRGGLGTRLAIGSMGMRILLPGHETKRVNTYTYTYVHIHAHDLTHMPSDMICTSCVLVTWPVMKAALAQR